MEQMRPIVIDNPKDLIIILLGILIFIFILNIYSYYRWVRDTRDTVESAMKGLDKGRYF